METNPEIIEEMTYTDNDGDKYIIHTENGSRQLKVCCECSCEDITTLFYVWRSEDIYDIDLYCEECDPDTSNYFLEDDIYYELMCWKKCEKCNKKPDDKFYGDDNYCDMCKQDTKKNIKSIFSTKLNNDCIEHLISFIHL